MVVALALHSAFSVFGLCQWEVAQTLAGTIKGHDFAEGEQECGLVSGCCGQGISAEALVQPPDSQTGQHLSWAHPPHFFSFEADI